MANYPQLDDIQGVWKMKDISDARKSGLWRYIGQRAVFAGGNEGDVGGSNVMDYVTIATAGNASDFGNLQGAYEAAGGFGSHTRAFFASSASPSQVIDFVQIDTTGNSADFGDMATGAFFRGGAASSTRGLFSGGDGSPDINNIEYITMATLGDGTDFGDLTVARRNHGNHSSSPTRACFTGGQVPASQNVIDYVEIATTGNALDFGDLTAATGSVSSCGSSTRGITGAGYVSAAVSTAQFITIAR